MKCANILQQSVHSHLPPGSPPAGDSCPEKIAAKPRQENMILDAITANLLPLQLMLNEYSGWGLKFSELPTC